MAASPKLPIMPRRRDFLAASAARKAAEPGMVVQANPRADAPFRIGFTVTRKVGNAVVRNRARRRLRAAADIVLRAAPPSGFDIVLVGRAGTLDRPFDQLCDDLRRGLARTGVTP